MSRVAGECRGRQGKQFDSRLVTSVHLAFNLEVVLAVFSPNEAGDFR